jgi:transcriptional regulator with XRE-family HTH domain
MAKYDQWLTEEGLLLIEGWARDGLTDEQIAHNMGISRSTLAEWKKKHSDISDALKKGKEVIDRQVENALLKKALGYRYDEVVYEDGKEVRRITKEVQPDTTALIFWLKNRKPAEWRDKQNIEHSGSITYEKLLGEIIDEQGKN